MEHAFLNAKKKITAPVMNGSKRSSPEETEPGPVTESQATKAKRPRLVEALQGSGGNTIVERGDLLTASPRRMQDILTRSFLAGDSPYDYSVHRHPTKTFPEHEISNSFPLSNVRETRSKSRNQVTSIIRSEIQVPKIAAFIFTKF
jgi:hypothetical protein